MTTAQQALETRRKIVGLEEGEIIYIHPASTSESAYFGQFNGRLFYTEKAEENIRLFVALVFSFDENYKLWIPNEVWGENMIYPIDDIVNGRATIYSGLYEIEGAFELKDNPNIGLVKRILEKCQ